MNAVSESFRLRLSNGQRWSIIAGASAIDWTRRLAAVMALEPETRPDGHRLYFTRSIEQDLGFGIRDLSSQSRTPNPEVWQTVDLEFLKFWFRRPDPSDLQTGRDPAEVICELSNQRYLEKEYMQMEESLLPIFRLAARAGGIPFHCALIARDGKAVLLGANSGIGKSTCASRVPQPWQGISDDHALIVKAGPGKYLVHPFPTWSDYVGRRRQPVWHVEAALPLQGVFLMEQGDRDEAAPVAPARAAVLINMLANQVSSFGIEHLEPSELRTLRLEFLDSAVGVARSVPAFTLKVSLTGQFWLEIERALSARG